MSFCSREPPVAGFPALAKETERTIEVMRQRTRQGASVGCDLWP